MSSDREEPARPDTCNVRKRRRSSRGPRRALAHDNEETTITVFKRLATERIKVMQNGKQTTMTLAEAILVKTCNAALQGDPVAMNSIWRLAEQAGEFQDRNDPEKVGKPIFMPRRFESIEEFVAYTGINVIKR